MADRGRASVIAWTGVTTCVLVAGALVFVLRSAHAPLGVSDRSGLVSMAAALPALVIAVLAALWARPGGYEDEAAAVARLAREVRAVGEPQWAHSLGGDLTAIDVTFTFRPYAHARAAALPATPAGQLERAVEDYRALRPRRLVVTGEAGAGKTVLAWKLVMELNKARTEREPVPVLMALADWDEEEAVGDWIARHLERDYGLPPRSARLIVEARMVLPVLDGLDEMDAADTPVGDSRASLALDALARHQDGTDPAPLILTCRTRQYDALEADAHHLLDAARIEIDPVTPDRALRFLELRGAARRPALWQPLLDELRFAPGGVVSRALSTPWRLTLAATVYERDGDPGELLAAHSVGEAADLLLRRYVPTAVRGAGWRCGAADVHRRLAILARSLDSAGGAQTDLRLRQVSRRLGGYWPMIVLRALVLGCVVVSIWIRTDPWPKGFDLVMLVVTVASAVLSLVTVLSEHARRYFRLQPSWYVPELGSPLWRVGVRLAVKGTRRRWQVILFGVAVLGCVVLAVPRAEGGPGVWWGALAGVPLLLVSGVVLATQWINVAAVGPSGWVRGAILAAVGMGGAMVVMVATWHPLDSDMGAEVAMLSAVAFAGGYEWMEYALFLLVTPQLPFRLAKFLDRSVASGLMRTSGVTYQFRHREFQEWLVRHPVAVPLP
ncbi:NACHT domain-containing protein [Streptomyces prunicolor]|uniref:NACHT domain-containing protein n=1 Tax=Streptomyces prunicolor TaxID=67348 RepID=UPI003434BAB3